jgi:ferredoxin
MISAYIIFLFVLCVGTVNGFNKWEVSPTATLSRVSLRLCAKLVTVKNLDNNETIEIDAGSPLSLAASKSGMKLSFQCKQGTCKSCTTILDGKAVDTCMTKVPEKAKIEIKKKKRLG